MLVNKIQRNKIQLTYLKLTELDVFLVITGQVRRFRFLANPITMEVETDGSQSLTGQPTWPSW